MANKIQQGFASFSIHGLRSTFNFTMRAACAEHNDIEINKNF
jgi:hypothetical protein